MLQYVTWEFGVYEKGSGSVTRPFFKLKGKN